MKYYLVDYENVGKDGLSGIDALSKNDTVCIFYSEKADTMSFGLHEKINESRAKILFQKADNGTKNSLDFQLATFLGYLVCENRNREYYIVTRDHGYNALCSYWKKRNVKVAVVPELSAAEELPDTDELADRIYEVINDSKIAADAAECIRSNDSKQDIHNALAKKYPANGGRLARNIYKAVKPLLKSAK